MGLKNPKPAFSLLSLLLFVSLCCAVMALYISSAQQKDAERKYRTLLNWSDRIEISDPTLFHYQPLPQPAPLVFQYQVAVPRDTELELRVIGGRKSPDGTIPTLCTMELCGPRDGFAVPEQYTITVYFQNTSSGHRIGFKSEVDGLQTFVHTERLDWLDSLLETYTAAHPPPGYKLPVQTSEPTKTVTLHHQTENSETISGLVPTKENPGILSISVGPKSSSN